MTAEQLDQTGSQGLRIALSAAGTVTSQAVLVTAVLYYFGLVYTRSWFAHFGIDAAMLGFSVPDYVVRSIGAAYWPAVLTLLVVVALFGVRRFPLIVAARSRRPRRTLRFWVAAVFACGTILEVAVAVGILIRDDLPRAMSLYLPIMIVIGATLLGYAMALRSAYPTLLGWRHASRGHAPAWLPILALLLLGFLGGMWAVGSYAEIRAGKDVESAEAARFSDRPLILLLSVDRLAIEGGGSQVGEITAPGEKYRYAYSGLLLLARTADRYFLIPHEWKAKRDRVFVINNNDSIRIDIARHP
ncbi:hypothetical protein AB4305_23385 [Nocardia sp. 2YAB30]|uniref:hypothetical protein n=1 Tax=unclassified Nocardia TaxID=2637762 RepID=UPI003F9CEF0B